MLGNLVANLNVAKNHSFILKKMTHYHISIINEYFTMNPRAETSLSIFLDEII